MQQKSIEVDGRTWPYEIREGVPDGALLLVLTDTPGSARTFESQSDLPFRFAILPVDGDLEPGDRRVLTAVADAEQADEFIVMGTGVGSALALVAAAEAPHRIRAAVLVNPPVDAVGQIQGDSTGARWKSVTSLWDIAGTVRCPVLILRREESESFPVAALDRLRAALAFSYAQSVAASEDDLVSADPAFVEQAIRSFLIGRR